MRARVRRRARANRVANSQLTSRLQQAFSVVKIVKANRAEHRVLERFDRDSHRALDAAFLLRLEMVLLSALVMTIGGAALITTEYVLAGWVVVEAETYLGALVAGYIGFTVWNIGAFNTARGQTNETLGSGYGLVRVWCRAQDLFIGLDRAFHLLDLEPDVVDPVDPRSFPEPLARVAFRDLHFAYQPDKPVLEGVDFSAEAGTVTALLGATGAGKSTLMSLVLRLHDPDTGRVELQGIDLRDLRIDDIRANTAIALQKNILFAEPSRTISGTRRQTRPAATSKPLPGSPAPTSSFATSNRVTRPSWANAGRSYPPVSASGCRSPGQSSATRRF